MGGWDDRSRLDWNGNCDKLKVNVVVNVDVGGNLGQRYLTSQS